MKKPVIIGLVAALILAGGGFFAYNNWYNSTEHQTEVATESFANGNYEEALSTYQMLLEREPENVAFAQGACDSMVALGKHYDAVKALKALLMNDKKNVANWTALASEAKAADVSPLELGAIYVEAYDATQDASFDAWIQDHQPMMPRMELESGAYNGVYEMTITGDNYDCNVKVDGIDTAKEVVNGKLALDHGINEVTIIKTSPWGFTNAETYTYDINHLVVFKSEKFGQLFRELTGMDQVTYTDLDKVIEISLMGDHLYVRTNDKSYGEVIDTYSRGGARYGNNENGNRYTDFGTVATSEDFALFNNLEFLQFGNQPEGFSKGFANVKLGKVKTLSVMNQADFTQELLDSKVTKANQATLIMLWNTDIDDLNPLNELRKLEQLVVYSNETVNYDLIKSNDKITVYGNITK